MGFGALWAALGAGLAAAVDGFGAGAGFCWAAGAEAEREPGVL